MNKLRGTPPSQAFGVHDTSDIFHTNATAGIPGEGEGGWGTYGHDEGCCDGASLATNPIDCEAHNYHA
jgi:hypothetical protein